MRPSLDTDFFAAPLPRVFGHRGSAGTHPENTLQSFQAAVDAGAGYLELDVHLTRDGQVVVSHDDNLERTCGRAGAIKDLSWAEIASADAGYTFASADGEFPFRGKGIRIPRLAEVLSTFPNLRFNIDAKQEEPSVVEPLLRVIDAGRARRNVLLASENQKQLEQIRSLAPQLATNFGYQEVAAFIAAMASHDTQYRPAGDALQIPPEYYSWKLATPQTLEMAHRLGVEVHVWTVNEAAEMRGLLDIGVDGIMSDFPARLMRAAKERRRLVVSS